jgi:hypothetical protein
MLNNYENEDSMTKQYRHEWYERIYAQFPVIMAEAAAFGKKLGLGKLSGEIGLYSGASSVPARLPRFVLEAIVKANKNEILPLRAVEDRLRNVIKDLYGDDYDGAVANSCEAALRICIESLMAPPFMRKGDAYRSRMITTYSEDMEWGAAYGRAFPPKYKNLAVERSVTAGELGMEGKCLANVDTLFARFGGSRYEVHGVRQGLVPFLTRADVDATLTNIKRLAERNAPMLSGLHAIGYDTPGYGLGDKDKDGSPRLLQGMKQIADSYDVPLLVDCASCVPGLGFKPDKAGADLMLYSMDKAGRSPIAGLIVGNEELMHTVRKSMGLGGQRYGHVSSHGKAVFSAADPGRDAVVGLTAYLETVRDRPEVITKPVDVYHDILVEAFKELKPARFREKLVWTKSYHMGGTELNYLETWDDGDKGIPIFTLEDLYANTNPICLATEAMGVSPATIYGGNFLLNPGLGLLDEDGQIIVERAELAARALVESVNIVCRHAGLGD